MKTRYRIVTDNYNGFEVQFRPWWCPIWLQANRNGGWGANSCSSVDEARRVIERHKVGGAVEYVE